MPHTQDRGRGCRSSPVPSQRPPPSQPVSPGRARATWTDRTQRSWGSAGVTRDPGPNCPGTCGRCCLPTLLHCPTPTALRPLSLCPGAQSIFPLQGPPGVKGEKGDRGLPGLQVVGGRVLGTGPALGQTWPQPCQHLCSLPGLPRPPGRPRGGWPPGSKGGREARWGGS